MRNIQQGSEMEGQMNSEGRKFSINDLESFIGLAIARGVLSLLVEVCGRMNGVCHFLMHRLGKFFRENFTTRSF